MTPTDSNRDALSRLVEGDPAAWDRFLEEHLPVVYGTVLRALRSHGADPQNEADDLVQDVLVRLCRRNYELLRRFDAARASMATYLGVIARSVTIDALRRHRKTEPLDLENAPGEPPRAERPGLEIPDRLLSSRQRLVLHLLYDRDLDTFDVARILQIETQTVRSTHHKALKKLRRWLDDGIGERGPETGGPRT